MCYLGYFMFFVVFVYCPCLIFILVIVSFGTRLNNGSLISLDDKRACCLYIEFLCRTMILSNKILTRTYVQPIITTKVFGRHHNLVDQYASYLTDKTRYPQLNFMYYRFDIPFGIDANQGVTHLQSADQDMITLPMVLLFYCLVILIFSFYV